MGQGINKKVLESRFRKVLDSLVIYVPCKPLQFFGLSIAFSLTIGQPLVAETVDNHSANIDKWLSQASVAYHAEKYPRVIDLYEKVISQQPHIASEIYSNLGTAHYRNGSPGKAALWYRRAAFLNSDTPQVKQNLDVIEQTFGHHNFRSEPWHFWLLDISPELLKLLAWATLWLALFIALFVFFVKPPNMTPPLIMIIIFSVSTAGTLFYLNYFREHHLAPHNFATVIDTRSKAMASPAPSSEPIIDLPEGSEVKIIENTGPWLYVLIPGDHLGWIHHSLVEINWPIPE